MAIDLSKLVVIDIGPRISWEEAFERQYAHIPRASQFYKIEWKVPLHCFDYEAFRAMLPRVEKALNDMFAAPLTMPSHIYPDLGLRVEHMVRNAVEYFELGAPVPFGRLEFAVVERQPVKWAWLDRPDGIG